MARIMTVARSTVNTTRHGPAIAAPHRLHSRRARMRGRQGPRWTVNDHKESPTNAPHPRRHPARRRPRDRRRHHRHDGLPGRSRHSDHDRDRRAPARPSPPSSSPPPTATATARAGIRLRLRLLRLPRHAVLPVHRLRPAPGDLLARRPGPAWLGSGRLGRLRLRQGPRRERPRPVGEPRQPGIRRMAPPRPRRDGAARAERPDAGRPARPDALPPHSTRPRTSRPGAHPALRCDR